ncbi:hypothetical protein FAMCQIZV_CDS0059 [Phage C72C1]|nr:hypothetical protein FAMCQIZV_CDS0059 [Phage C72C1]
MEMSGLIDTLIGIVIAGGVYWLKTIQTEQKRIDILLNRTREEFATKAELRADYSNLMEYLHRIEDKLDKLITK